MGCKILKRVICIGVLGGGISGYTPYTNLRVFLTAYTLTSVIINKQGTFRPFATPLCVYPPPFLAIHNWLFNPDHAPFREDFSSAGWDVDMV